MSDSGKKEPFFRDPPQPREGAGGAGRRTPHPMPDDASIPVLTERLTLPPVELDFTLPLAPEAVTPRDPPLEAPRDAADLPEPEPQTLQPSPFVSFSMTSPVGRSFPAAPTFAPPVPPLSAPPPAALSVASGEMQLPVSPSHLPATDLSHAQVTNVPIPVAASAAASAAVSGLSAPAAASVPATGAQWARLELELRESILRELAERLPLDVESIVRRHMGNAVEEAIQTATTTLVARVAAEARLALATSLREIVDTAVRAELERLRGMKR